MSEEESAVVWTERDKKDARRGVELATGRRREGSRERSMVYEDREERGRRGRWGEEVR
jgi:hypothetical protein